MLVHNNSKMNTYKLNLWARFHPDFLHGFASADIPVGQEYDLIMRINNGIIDSDSVIKCKTTILCFFSEFKTQPIANAWQGHHASCQIRFRDGIPAIVQELYEITESKK